MSSFYGNGGGGSGGSKTVIPDWNANEGESGYIKNRIAYEEIGKVYLLPETTFYFGSQGIPGVVYVNFQPSYTIFTEDNKLNDLKDNEFYVTVDGTEYILNLTINNNNNNIYIGGANPGDSAILSLGASVQIIQNGQYSHGISLFSIAGEIGSHTVSIAVNKLIAHTIPDKYLPPNALFDLSDRMAKGNSYAVIEGHMSNHATGAYSHAEGYGTNTSGAYSHAEGNNTTASGHRSHAEGDSTTASGSASHAEGDYTTASGSNSHAEGRSYQLNKTVDGTIYKKAGAYGASSHSEGYNTLAINDYSHAEGVSTIASGRDSHAEGYSTTASDEGSHAEGYSTTASDEGSHAEGSSTTASGSASHAEGFTTTAIGNYSHAEGDRTIASGQVAHAEGSYSYAYGNQSHAEGSYFQSSLKLTGSANATQYTYSGTAPNIKANLMIIISGKLNQITSINTSTHKITFSTTLSTTAISNKAYTIYIPTQATEYAAHAEGIATIASGLSSHAEGQSTTASGLSSHAEGAQTTASGECSHAEGSGTTASGTDSHAEGSYTIANHKAQHVFGEYNIADSSTAGQFAHGNYIQIVGNGTTENSRSNARTLDWNGNETLAGKLTVGIAPVNDMDVATKKYVDDNAGGGSFSLSDRMAKGVDDNGNVVDGAIIEGIVVETEIQGTTVLPNKASGFYSHAEGMTTTASGMGAHAEGGITLASGQGAHAEGGYTTASGQGAHAEGGQTTASGTLSHAEGAGTLASGSCSHAEGSATIANHSAQHVFGEFNIADDSTAANTVRGNYVEIVGNGSSETNRSNARTLDWSGNEKLAGSLTLGKGTADEVTITAAQLTALLALLNT